MPIEVELPNGDVAEFPDGTSQETIRRALMNLQQRGWERGMRPNAPDNLGIGQGVASYPPTPSFLRPPAAQPSQGRGSAAHDGGRQAARGPLGQANAAVQTFARAVPFLDELGAVPGTLEGVVRGNSLPEAWSRTRDVQQGMADQLREDNPLLSHGSEAAGYTTQMLPMVRALQGVSTGSRAGNIARAATANATVGAAAGLGGEGTLEERGDDALANALIGGGAGGVLAGLGGALASRGAQARANPSPQRQLAALGVDEMTPGQLAGGIGRRIENGLTSWPGVGDPILASQGRSVQSMNRAAFNQALEPIRETLPRNTRMGVDAMTAADDLRSHAYRSALNGAEISADDQLLAALTAARTGRVTPAPQQNTLDAVFENYVTPRVQPGQAIAGDVFQQMDSDLGKFQRSAQGGAANDPGQQFLADALTDARGGLDEAFARSNPAQAEAYQNARRTAAMLFRLRDASQGLGTQARDGVFGVADLNRAVRAGDNSAGNMDFSHGDALLQNLSRPAAQVLPSNVPDSGSPFRLALGLGSAGGMSAAPGPVGTVGQAGLGAIAASHAVYNPVVIRAINRIYAATDPAAIETALGEMAQAASANPGLAQAYAQAQQAAQLRLSELQQGVPTQSAGARALP